MTQFKAPSTPPPNSPRHRRLDHDYVWRAARANWIFLTLIALIGGSLFLHSGKTKASRTDSVNAGGTDYLRKQHDPFSFPTSYITWCNGKDHASPGRCMNPDQIISVTEDLELFQLLLRRAMDARREMTSAEHAVLAHKFDGKTFRDHRFEEGQPGAYHVYSLYAHALTTPGLVQTKNHLWLEFGVFTGASCNITAYSQRHTNIQVHGFDTFTGLPEEWKGHHGAGHFDQGGHFPPVEPDIQLHKGLFSETLPGVLELHPEYIAGMNVDCDLYRGAIESLNITYPRWTAGTMLHFHELQQSPMSKELKFAKQEEVQALHEFLVSHPGTVLEMLPIRNSYAEPVVLFVVQKPLSQDPVMEEMQKW